MSLEMRAFTEAVDVAWHHKRWQEDFLDKSLRAVELACQLDDSYAQRWPRCLAGFALIVLGRARDVQTQMSSAMALAESLRDHDLLVWAAHISDLIAHDLGDWQAAQECL